jgi:ribonuclease P protein component
MHEGKKAESGSLHDGVVSENFRFQKKKRLKTPAQFNNVFNAAKKSIDSQFVVLAKKNGLGYSRLGLVVSKRKVARSVVRNSIKRIIRESFRCNSIVKEGYDIVVLPKKKVKTRDRVLLRTSLSNHWESISR